MKVGIYQGSFKYKHDSDAQRIWLPVGYVNIATREKDTNVQLWEKDIKQAVGFSLETLRNKLTLYMRLPLCVWISS
jgi:hypothetical protein